MMIGLFRKQSYFIIIVLRVLGVCPRFDVSGKGVKLRHFMPVRAIRRENLLGFLPIYRVCGKGASVEFR